MDIIAFKWLSRKKNVTVKAGQKARLKSQYRLFMPRLPWPTFQCGVAFDVEDLIGKKKSKKKSSHSIDP